ncbi:hypothetical protein WJX77_009765 [Trebouxia sp. C0004]
MIRTIVQPHFRKTSAPEQTAPTLKLPVHPSRRSAGNDILHGHYPGRCLPCDWTTLGFCVHRRACWGRGPVSAFRQREVLPRLRVWREWQRRERLLWTVGLRWWLRL